MTEIEAILHQVRVAKEDVNILQILWWPNVNVSDNLE